jgi:hypothetical protein
MAQRLKSAWTKRNARSEDKRNGPCERPTPGPSWSATPAAACVRVRVECAVSRLPLAATDAGAAGRVRQYPADSVGRQGLKKSRRTTGIRVITPRLPKCSGRSPPRALAAPLPPRRRRRPPALAGTGRSGAKGAAPAHKPPCPRPPRWRGSSLPCPLPSPCGARRRSRQGRGLCERGALHPSNTCALTSPQSSPHPFPWGRWEAVPADHRPHPFRRPGAGRRRERQRRVRVRHRVGFSRPRSAQQQSPLHPSRSGPAGATRMKTMALANKAITVVYIQQNQSPGEQRFGLNLMISMLNQNKNSAGETLLPDSVIKLSELLIGTGTTRFLTAERVRRPGATASPATGTRVSPPAPAPRASARRLPGAQGRA